MSPTPSFLLADQLLRALAFCIVLIALGIISVKSIQWMISLYRVQSLVLAMLAILIALQLREEGVRAYRILIAFAILIPGMLAYIIEPLLAYATVRQEIRWTERLGHPFLRPFRRRYLDESRQVIQEALPIWLEHGLPFHRQAVSITVSLVLVTIAYNVGFNPISRGERAQSLAIAMTLLMLGVFTMINRRDLISQIMGLLVMDHGLFLAAVRFIAHPRMIPIFVISLFLYILITLVILVILLPELHGKSKTIEVAEQDTLRG